MQQHICIIITTERTYLNTELDSCKCSTLVQSLTDTTTMFSNISVLTTLKEDSYSDQPHDEISRNAIHFVNL